MLGVSEFVCVGFLSVWVNFLANNIVVLDLALGPGQFEGLLVEELFGRSVEVELQGKVVAEWEWRYMDSLGFWMRLKVCLSEVSGVPKLAPLLWMSLEGVALMVSLPQRMFLWIFWLLICKETG